MASWRVVDGHSVNLQAAVGAIGLLQSPHWAARWLIPKSLRFPVARGICRIPLGVYCSSPSSGDCG